MTKVRDMSADEEARAVRLITRAGRWRWVLNSATAAALIVGALAVLTALGFPLWSWWLAGPLLAYGWIAGAVAQWRMRRNMERAGLIIWGDAFDYERMRRL